MLIRNPFKSSQFWFINECQERPWGVKTKNNIANRLLLFVTFMAEWNYLMSRPLKWEDRLSEGAELKDGPD